MSAITCLRHACDRKVVQLFWTTPTKCSACNQDITGEELRYLTVIPCPFKQANRVKCDVVIALSADQSGSGFDGVSGLHIGVCDSNGRVLEFDRLGISYDEPAKADGIWQKCSNLDIMRQIGIDKADDEASARNAWDQTMDATQAEFVATPYDDQTNNCLDFVQKFLSEFLRQLKKDGKYLSSQQVDELSSRCSNKVEFCRHFVLTKTRELARYIALDRSLKMSANLVSGQVTVDQP